MVDGNKENRKKTGRFNRNRSRTSGNANISGSAKANEQPVLKCAICNNQLFDLSNALANRTDGKPVHFDCALEKLKATESIGPTERLSYIGKGTFAIIEYKDKNMTSFVIKRKIQWEKEGEEFSWRKDILRNYDI